MTASEFSREFDLLYNNIMSGVAPGINEYEKSVFLTKAQEDLLKNYFNPKGNKYQEGVQDSHKRNIDFSEYIKETVISDLTNDAGVSHFYKNTLVADLPQQERYANNDPNGGVLIQGYSDVMFPLNLVLVKGDSLSPNNYTGRYPITVLKDTELKRLFTKPYKAPFKGQVYAVYNSLDTMANSIQLNLIVNDEIYQDFNSNKYFCVIRYVQNPKPIILTNLIEFSNVWIDPTDSPLTINGYTEVSLPIKNESLAREILDRAVNLAKVHYEMTPQEVVQYSANNE